MKDYNYIDLFSGIGGFALGAYWAGMKFKNHFFSEVDGFGIELYQKRFLDSIPLGDITKIDLEELKSKYGSKWIITGGFPCQDISVAGRGEGIHGKRSSLWFRYYETIRILQPRFAIIENVGMLVNRGLDTVLSNLAEIGYDAEWQDIRAEDMGAPHRRERIWIVAYSKLCGYLHGQIEKQSTETGEFTQCDIGTESEMADPNSQGLQRRKESRNIKSSRQKRKQLFKRQSQSYRGKYWATEPSVGRLVDGLSGRVDRLKGLGNAIVPQIAELLFNQIKPYLEDE